MNKHIDTIVINGVEYEVSPIHSDDSLDVDLAIADNNNNVGVILSKGHIRTSKFDSSSIFFEPTYEQGGITGEGYDSHLISDYDSLVRTAFFIDVYNAKYIRILNDSTVFEYDKSHALLQFMHYNAGYVELHQACHYIRIVTNVANPIYLYGSTSTPCETKRVQMRHLIEDDVTISSDALIYKVDENICSTARLALPPNYSAEGNPVPLIIWDSGDGSFTDWDSHEMGEKYIRRVIGLKYLRDSGFAVLEIYSWGSYYHKMYPGCGSRSAMPIPTHLATHEKGVEYVLSRYNVSSENIFHLSKSGSGKIALYYAMKKPSFNLRSIYAFAPVFDDLNFNRWGMPDYRKALFDELNLQGSEEQVEQFRNGYEGDAKHGWLLTRGPYDGDIDAETLAHLHEINQDFVRKNIEKFTTASVSWMNVIGQSPEEKFQDTMDWGYKVWETDRPNWANHEEPDEEGNYPIYNRKTDVYNKHDLTMIGNHIPIKVVMSKNDEQTPYWSALMVINQLRNGGTDATIYPLTSQGHGAPDMGTGINAMSDITTRLGIHYDSVPIGWYIAVEDIYNRFLKSRVIR